MCNANESKEIPVKITHIADPKRYPVERVTSCVTIDLGCSCISNPAWREGSDEQKKYISGSELYENMLEAGWVASMIGWTRDDGVVNFGQAPTVNHRLMAVLVHLKPESKQD